MLAFLSYTRFTVFSQLTDGFLRFFILNAVRVELEEVSRKEIICFNIDRNCVELKETKFPIQ